jgi:phage shock protein PspC (stress-responsive transcriptional regulator)
MWTVPVLASGPDLGGTLSTGVAKTAGYSTNNVDQYTLSATVGRIIKIALSFVGTIFFALAVYAGFLWMTAQGNEDKVEKATKIIRTAVVGMIIVLAAYSITTFAMIWSAQANKLI